MTKDKRLFKFIFLVASPKFFKRHSELCKAVVRALCCWVHGTCPAGARTSLFHSMLLCYDLDEMLWELTLVCISQPTVKLVLIHSVLLKVTEPISGIK